MINKLKSLICKKVNETCVDKKMISSLSVDERALLIYLLNNPKSGIDILINHDAADELIIKNIVNEISRNDKTRRIVVNKKYRSELGRLFFTSSK